MAENDNLYPYKIDCKKYKIGNTENTLGDEKQVILNNSNAFYGTFIMECDDENDNNSFNLEYYGDDDFKIERNRCELDVYLKPNKTPFKKYFTIICTHANDRSVYVQIEIVQKEEEYKLEISQGAERYEEKKYKKELKSIVDEKFTGTHADLNYNFYEKCDFNFNILGGNKKYKIESIVKCHVDNSDQENVITNYEDFDNGFKYNVFSDKLVIMNYGRPFLENDDYYLIRFCHENYKDLKIELKLTYSTETSSSTQPNNETPSDFDISDIYSQYNFVINSDIDNNGTQEEVNCSIVFEGTPFVEAQGKKTLTIAGQPTQQELPFNVYENGQISDLKVKVYSSGTWCSASTDATNRKLLIKINDKPICERKSLVNVSIISYPKVNVSFIVINSNNS